jgi:predicted O-linked N-acetylglucosamine transferase (SPINDLY family)
MLRWIFRRAKGGGRGPDAPRTEVRGAAGTDDDARMRVGRMIDAALELHQAGRLAEADAAYREVLAIDPRNSDALHFLGVIAQQQGALESAATWMSQAVAANPANVHAHDNLGKVLEAQGKLADAIACYQRVIELAPERADAHFSLGNAYLAKSELERAVVSYRRVLELKQDHAEAHFNLGIAARSLGRRGEAAACFRRVIELRPDLADAHYCLGHVLCDEDRVDEAVPCFRRALALRPEYAEARWSLAMAGLPAVYDGPEEPKRTRAEFSVQLGALERWFDGTHPVQGYGGACTDLPFRLAYQEEDNRELLARHGRLCARLMAQWFARQGFAGPGPRSVSDPVRVGIVSRYFHSHSVWNAIVKGWFQEIDRERFELLAFCLGTAQDSETQLARSRAAHFEAGNLDLSQWVQAILAQRPDILIYPEVGMDPLTARLASLRLARVQVATWGHPETTGLPTIDYYLSGQDLEPPDAQRFYTERLVELPNVGCCFEPWRADPAVPDLTKWGIEPDAPLLLCPGTPFKYAPQHDQVYVEIARRLGRGRLLFFGHSVSALSDKLKRRLAAAFAAGGLDIDRFVTFVPWQSRPAFYGLLRHADAFLDTIGFSGFNTAAQAIECGLPIVTREGRYLRGRLASGILRRIGAGDLVAPSDEDYVRQAVQLVEDRAFQARVRSRIAEGRRLLFQDAAPIRALERFLLEAAALERR